MLPSDVPILREPFTAAKLLAIVNAEPDGKAEGKRPVKAGGLADC
jgi:hypothetical protein